jgi:hypothetical protein
MLLPEDADEVRETAVGIYQEMTAGGNPAPVLNRGKCLLLAPARHRGLGPNHRSAIRVST